MIDFLRKIFGAGKVKHEHSDSKYLSCGAVIGKWEDNGYDFSWVEEYRITAINNKQGLFQRRNGWKFEKLEDLEWDYQRQIWIYREDSGKWRRKAKAEKKKNNKACSGNNWEVCGKREE